MGLIGIICALCAGAKRRDGQKKTRPGQLSGPRAFYSDSSRRLRLLRRRMAFFFSMRRTSLLDTNQRLLRSCVRMPLRMTFFLKRLSSCSCDSFGRSVTEVIRSHLLATKSPTRAGVLPSRPGERSETVLRATTIHEGGAQFTLPGRSCQRDFHAACDPGCARGATRPPP